MASKSLPPWINAPLQTAVAAMISLTFAHLLNLPDGFWAPISAIVCSLDAFSGAAQVARRRLLGTLFGVIVAGFQISLAPFSLLSYAVAIFALGVICGLARLHSSAFRFGAIAMTVVVTAEGSSGVWITAATRFVDVSLGILVALAVVRVWPKQEKQP